MHRLLTTLVILLSVVASTAFAADTPHFERDIAPLLKRHCVKCHGPVKQEGKFNASSPSGLIRGGENGAVLVPHDVEASLLWKRIASDEMPPDAPLSADEKSLFKRGIIAGTPGLAPDAKGADASDHWAFRELTRVNVSESPRHVPSPPSSGERASSLLKNVAWTPRPSEKQLEKDGRGVHPTILQHAAKASGRNRFTRRMDASSVRVAAGCDGRDEASILRLGMPVLAARPMTRID